MAFKYIGANFLNQKSCLSNKSQIYQCKVRLKELSNWPIPKPSQTWFPSSVADHPSSFFALHMGYLFFEFNHLCMFLIFVFFQTNILDLLIKQGNELKHTNISKLNASEKTQWICKWVNRPIQKEPNNSVIEWIRKQIKKYMKKRKTKLMNRQEMK